MKVAFLVDAYPAPSETFVANQIAAVAARGHAVDIYACAAPGATADTRVRSLAAPRGPRRVAAAAALVARALRRRPGVCVRALDPLRGGRAALTLRLLFAAAPFLTDGARAYDVIHCQFGPLGVLALRLRRIGALHGTLITAFRGYDATKYLRRNPRVYDELFRDGDMFLPVSEELKRILVAHGADAGKIEVHHSGVDCAAFAYRPRLRAHDGPTHLVSIGRLVEKKGIEYAIRAAAQVIARGRALEYDIVGDGPLRESLQRLVVQLNMQAHIRLCGWRTHAQVAALLECAHVLTAPSVTAADGDQEGIANVLKEAMAAGLPVVATRHGGTAELVEDGVSGFLVPERDVDALAERLTHLIDRPDRWPAMGRAGRSKVETDFDLYRLNDRLERLYQRLAYSRAANPPAQLAACAADDA